MANGKPKLELTWIGKGENPKLEPRILIEDPTKSYGDKNAENMLIYGDNLLALKALEQDFAGKIKCIYIDPPYNTGNAFEHYDDSLEHSIWLNLIKQRLDVINKLLDKKGSVILVQIDKNESAYLKILMDEIFGRSNYITTIAVRMSATSGFKIEHSDKTIVKNVEHIHLYGFNFNIKPSYERTEYDNHYSFILKNNDDKLIISSLIDEPSIKKELNKYELKISSRSLSKLYSISEKFRQFIFDNKDVIGRIHTAPSEALNNKELLKLLPDEYTVIEFINSRGQKYYLKKQGIKLDQYIPIALKFNYVDSPDGYKEELSNILGDWWDDFYLDMGNVEDEGGVSFKASKKPERLLFRILNMFTNKDDIVLDSFLGSGTTSAVAHKMGRRWIGIELGDHCHTHCIPRLKKVCDGTDQGGISEAQNWKGGGGFKYYYLAPSLLLQDHKGNWIINKQYNPAMLAAAMAKHEGFHFQPDETYYWKQGKSTEKDFIFTTTNFVSVELIDTIHSEMKEDESLLICCTSFSKAADKYSNITIKKIPKMLLGRCEFGKDDYSLNIINLPRDNDEPDFVPTGPIATNKSKKKKMVDATEDLFSASSQENSNTKKRKK